MAHKVLLIGKMNNKEIRDTLKKHGFEVEHYLNEIDEKAILKQYPDIILFLRRSPSTNDIIKGIRRRNPFVPIMNVFPSYDEIDIIVTLEVGGDDYIVEPIRQREFIAKIKALLRRASFGSSNNRSPYQLLKVKDIYIYPEQFKTVYNEKEIYLRVQEFKLLCFLARNKGKILTRREMMKELNFNVSDVDSRIIDVYINKLRTKLKLQKDITTIRNAGYLLKDTEEQ